MGPELPVLTIGGSLAVLRPRQWVPLREAVTLGLMPGPILMGPKNIERGNEAYLPWSVNPFTIFGEVKQATDCTYPMPHWLSV